MNKLSSIKYSLRKDYLSFKVLLLLLLQTVKKQLVPI